MRGDAKELEVLGRTRVGAHHPSSTCRGRDRLLEARELDDDETVEFLRVLEDLELAAARQNPSANFPMIVGARSAYFLTDRDC
jgi:hypothetical protein